MRRDIEIRTSAYDKPYLTSCIFEDNSDVMKIKWKQKHEGDTGETVYDLSMDKASGVATITRWSEAIRALCVIRPRAGGQSMMMKS